MSSPIRLPLDASSKRSGPVFAPQYHQRSGLPPVGTLSSIVKDMIPLPALILIGALLQAVLSAVLPLKYCFVIVVASLVVALRFHLLEFFKLSSAERISGNVITHKVTGVITSHGKKSSVSVVHLGIRINSPLGIFDPDAKFIGQTFEKQMKHLELNHDDFGYLGSELVFTSQNTSNNSFINIMYFKSYEHVMRFAHEAGGPHMEAVKWYSDLQKNRPEIAKKIGIWHEVYNCSPEQYEGVYINMYPIALANLWQESETEPGKYESTMRHATGYLRSSRGRFMGTDLSKATKHDTSGTIDYDE